MKMFRILACALAVAAAASSSALPGNLAIAQTVSQAALPDRLSDQQFWTTISQISEEGGRFNSENWTSNELQIQRLIAPLQDRIGPGGVYLGVGPEQNYSYIAGLRPRIAFIVDIRRQNLVLHLMYKAAMEMSPTRAEFLARLFSRELPAGVDSGSSTDALMEAFGNAEADSLLFERNLTEVRDWLQKRHGFALTPSDTAALRHVMGTFSVAGTDISYLYRRGAAVRATTTTFARLMIATDADDVNRSFLASEESYGVVRGMHERNLIVPVVGDFAGDRALRAVGDFLRRHSATVSAFYVSNVESYLFREPGAWPDFIANVETLPLDSGAVFIRPTGLTTSAFTVVRRPEQAADSSMVVGVTGQVERIPLARDASRTPFSNILSTIAAHKSGTIRTYQDVFRIDRE